MNALLPSIVSSLYVGCLLLACQQQPSAQQDPWSKVDSIIQEVKAPVFPDRILSLSAVGAQGDGISDDRLRLQQAIDSIHQSGGGTVHIPANTYFCNGPLRLKSHVHLQLDSGAVIRFGTDPDAYLPAVYSRWEGTFLMNYSPLIYALDQENIAITGKGIIDGAADTINWYRWNGKEKYGWREGMPTQKAAQQSLRKMGQDGTPVQERLFGDGHYLRPNLFQPIRCRNIYLSGVEFRNSPMWLINPILCENVLVDGLTFRSFGPNSDGIDPEHSRNVLIQNCQFYTGDDCVAVKAGRDREGREVGVPSENIVIRNCYMQGLRSVFALGSEMSAGIQHVYYENCTITSLENSARLIRFKSNTDRGGFIRHVYFRNIDATKARFQEGVFFFDMCYGGCEHEGTYIPSYSDFSIEHVKVGHAGGYAFKSNLLEASPLQGLQLRHIEIDGVGELPDLQHIHGLEVEDVRINGEKWEITP
ncbi:MAG: glycoside hydrolase family 28 protein [Bacteroidota bacterium]